MKAPTLQGGILRARKSRKAIIEPRPNEIQIDLDGARALHVFSRQWRMADARGLTKGWTVKIRPSFTVNHAHLTIRLPRRRPLRERVLLAALFGSDLKREMFNYIRVTARRRLPVAFFEKSKP